MALGYVFTPVLHSQRGYASALVASMSQMALDRGKQFSVLFADNDNPVSNHLYRKLGFRPVSDVIQMTISPKVGG